MPGSEVVRPTGEPSRDTGSHASVEASAPTAETEAGEARDSEHTANAASDEAAVGEPRAESGQVADGGTPPGGSMDASQAWGNYSHHSGSASDRARHLALAGIALIWILSGGGVGNVDKVQIDGHYVWPLYILIVALVADFLQYAYLSGAWRVVARRKEILASEGRAAEALAEPPWWTVTAGEAFFIVKLVLVTVGYAWLLVAAGQQLL